MGFELFWSIIFAEPILTLAILVIFIGTSVFASIVNLLRQEKLKKSGILEVDKMKGKVFEEYLQVLLRSKGYKVNLTAATGDYGADLVLSTKDKKIVVQAKRYKKKVGLKAVQEVVSAKSYYQADECWVVTNNYFTEPAVKLSRSNRVRLIDRDLLFKWMLEFNKVA
uniref:Restriction endonuclease n=2 Tax=Niallia circulans TaxID=1397 RepID=A0A941JQH8_NIACI|nr:restriction endonuclease [Niallia circulans]